MALPFYEPLVAPIVPVADNTAAKIIAQGDIAGAFTRGFAAMAEQNARRRQLELDAQKLQQADKLATDQHAFEREKLDQQGELMRSTIDARNKVAEAHAYAYKTNADTNAKRVSDALTGSADYNKQLQALENDATSRASELKLDDPAFQTKNPVEFAANLQKFKDEFGQAPNNTGIPARLKSWEGIANQQTIPLKMGAVYDEESGTWKGGGEAKPVPLWKVVRDALNPSTNQQMVDALTASGHMKTLDTVTKIAGGDVPTKVTTPDSLIQEWMNKGQGVDWTPSASRVPTFVPRGSRGSMIKSGQQLYDTAEPAAPDFTAATAIKNDPNLSREEKIAKIAALPGFTAPAAAPEEPDNGNDNGDEADEP